MFIGIKVLHYLHLSHCIYIRPEILKFWKRRINFLEYADNAVKDIEAVKLAYVDMHGNFKMMFNEPVNRKFMHAFNSKMQLVEIIARIDNEDPSDM